MTIFNNVGNSAAVAASTQCNVPKRFKSDNVPVESCDFDTFNFNSVTIDGHYQVATLANRASRVAAQYIMNKRVQKLANEELDLYAELVAHNLTGKALVDYINLKGGLWNLKKHFTTAKFQALFIQIHKELARNRKQGLNKELKYLLAEFETMLSAQNTHVEDSVWLLRMKNIYQPNVTSEKKKYLETESTSHRDGFTKYPRPQFDHREVNFPVVQTTFKHRQMTCYDLEKSRFLDDCPPRQVNFMASILFFFMRAMTEHEQQNKWHFVFTFGMYLLSSSSGLFTRFSSNCNTCSYEQQEFYLPPILVAGGAANTANRDDCNMIGIKWYKHDIIGKCAVALSHFQVNLSVVLYCLKHMTYYERYPSCKLMTCLYYQQTFAVYNQSKKEQNMFVQIYNGAPHKSYIWQKSLTVHFGARIKQAENFLGLILLHKKFHQKCTICVAYPRPIIMRALKKLHSLERLCYTVLASSQVRGPFAEVVETNWLCIIKTFILAFENSENCHWVAKQERIKKLTFAQREGLNFSSRKEVYQKVRYLLPLVNKSNTLVQYQSFCDKVIKHNHTVCCTSHNTVNADFYFSQYLLLRSLKCQYEESLRQLCLAQNEYQKSTNELHYRLPLVSLLVKVELNGLTHLPPLVAPNPTLPEAKTVAETAKPIDITESILNLRESLEEAQIKAATAIATIPFSVQNLLDLGKSSRVPDILRFGLDGCKLFVNR